jgi:hypothetical protein
MKRGIMGLMAVVIFMVTSVAAAVTTEDFQAKTTQNIINLCSVRAGDPMAREAIHFCQGYLVGAYHYYMAMSTGPDSERLVCFPKSDVSRDEAIAMFVEWAKAHPQFINEAPVETEFRFLIEKWPCKK